MNGKKECNKHQIYHTHTDPSNLDFNLYINPCYHTVPVPVNSMTIVWCGGGCTHTHTDLRLSHGPNSPWKPYYNRLGVFTVVGYCPKKKQKKTSKLKIVTNQNMIKLKSVVVCCFCCFHILQIYGTTRSFFLVANQIHQRLWWSSKES